MASVTALRAIVGASLGLGVVDLLWIDVALGPAAVGAEPPPIAAGAQPALATATPALASPPVAKVVEPPAPQSAASASAEPPSAQPPSAEPPSAQPPSAQPPSAEPPSAQPVVAAIDRRVYFATRSAALDGKARRVLDALIARPGAFVLEGHADIHGGEQDNEALSHERARAVAGYLARRGVASTRIVVRYVGEAAAEASAPAELWRDRRVDIHLTEGAP